MLQDIFEQLEMLTLLVQELTGEFLKRGNVAGKWAIGANTFDPHQPRLKQFNLHVHWTLPINTLMQRSIGAHPPLQWNFWPST